MALLCFPKIHDYYSHSVSRIKIMIFITFFFFLRVLNMSLHFLSIALLAFLKRAAHSFFIIRIITFALLSYFFLLFLHYRSYKLHLHRFCLFLIFCIFSYPAAILKAAFSKFSYLPVIQLFFCFFFSQQLSSRSLLTA